MRMLRRITLWTSCYLVVVSCGAVLNIEEAQEDPSFSDIAGTDLTSLDPEGNDDRQAEPEDAICVSFDNATRLGARGSLTMLEALPNAE